MSRASKGPLPFLKRKHPSFFLYSVSHDIAHNILQHSSGHQRAEDSSWCALRQWLLLNESEHVPPPPPPLPRPPHSVVPSSETTIVQNGATTFTTKHNEPRLTERWLLIIVTCTSIHFNCFTFLCSLEK